jgi:multiple sugar transport system substrate-binding protein
MPKFIHTMLAAATFVLLASLQQVAAQTTIRMWTFLNPAGTSPREVALAQIITRFERANPGIKVSVEPQVWDQLSPKFLAAARAGNAPDITWVVTDMLGESMQSGELADLRPLFIDRWTDAQRAGRKDAFWDTCSIDGKQYCLVTSRNYIAILYRRDLFQQAGIDPASLNTWPAFTAAAQKLTQRNAAGEVTRWGFGQAFSETQADPQMMIPVMLGLQGKLFESNGRAAFATPAGIAALTRQIGMVTEAKVTPPDAVGWTVDDDYEAFAAGRVAMMEGASVRVSTLQAKLGADKVGMLLWPGENGKEHSPGMTAGWAVTLWSHGKNIPAAAKFLEYFTGPEADTILVQTAGQMPTTPESRAASADYLNRPENAYLSVAAEGVAKYSWLVPTNIAAYGFRQVLNRAAQEVLTSKTAPEAALKAAEQTFNRNNHVQ